MSAKLVVLAAALAVCCAKPFSFSTVPGGEAFLRSGRAPAIAYGFGSGFASDIAGVKHSNSIGASFQTGDAEAFGSGIGSTDGNIFADGVGYANANPAPAPAPAPAAYSAYPYASPYAASPYAAAPYIATPYYTYPYNVGYNNYRTPLRDSYGNAAAAAQNFGGYGTSIAQSQNGPFGAVASAANINQSPFQTRNGFGNFGGSAISSSVSSGFGANAFSSANGAGQAMSIAQTRDSEGGINAAVAASEEAGGARGSTAQTIQQRGGSVQHSGATSIDGGPGGIQASHAHAVNNGAGTFY